MLNHQLSSPAQPCHLTNASTITHQQRQQPPSAVRKARVAPVRPWPGHCDALTWAATSHGARSGDGELITGELIITG